MNLTNVIAERPDKTVYRDGALGIKVFHKEYSAADVLNEALNMAIVSETGFRVPQLHEVCKVDGLWAIVMDYVEGETLAQIMQREPNKKEECIARLVEIQMQMHRYSAPRLRHHTDKMRDKIAKNGLDATVRYELHTRLEGLPKHNKLCHGDLSPSNIIIMPNGEACVLDWAHATQGNGGADAARTYMLFRLAGEHANAEEYMRRFCRESDTARQYIQKWLAVVAASQMVKGNPEERDFLLSWANVVEYQ